MQKISDAVFPHPTRSRASASPRGGGGRKIPLARGEAMEESPAPEERRWKNPLCQRRGDGRIPFARGEAIEESPLPEERRWKNPLRQRRGDRRIPSPLGEGQG